jgi:putative ABC transport system permease protein
MRLSRRLRFLDEDDFSIDTKDSILKAYTNITGAIFVTAILIAMVSLVVGGIGIMNIMLVSVRERTREIGVRMAMGARRKDILVQFLIEAITVSAIGGVLGITVGVAGLKAAGSAFPDVPIQIGTGSVVLAFFFSLAAGVFFGVYPARKAARLDPIECLRYE